MNQQIKNGTDLKWLTPANHPVKFVTMNAGLSNQNALAIAMVLQLVPHQIQQNLTAPR